MVRMRSPVQIRLAAPHSRKASLATPRRNSVGCSRMCLRLCLRVAKIRTFAPLLVPLRCAGTIALLSDFCSAGWRLPPPVLSRLARTRHPAPPCGVFSCPLPRCGGLIKLLVVFKLAPNKLFVSGVSRNPPPPSLRVFLPRVRKSIVLLKCGTNFLPLEKSLCLALT